MQTKFDEFMLQPDPKLRDDLNARGLLPDTVGSCSPRWGIIDTDIEGLDGEMEAPSGRPRRANLPR
jgi:hypothetical protein